MSLAEGRIKRSVGWLCENGSPPVKYLTQRHLLGVAPDIKQLQYLWHEVQGCDDVLEIFSKQRADGSWYAGGSWANKPGYLQVGGCTPYSPKYATTIWVLILLGDMGFDVGEPRVQQACEFAMGFQHPDGTFGSLAKATSRRARPSPEPLNSPCHFAGYLTGLAKVGMGTDPRLDRSYDLLYRWQRDDGGWLKESHLTGEAAPYKVRTRSCPFLTYFACQALRHSGRAQAREPLRRGLDFLARHLATKSPEEPKRFFYHGHETVKDLLMFSQEGTPVPGQVMDTLLDWLIGMLDPQTGRCHYEGKPISQMSRRVDGHTPRELKYRLYHVIEDGWLTYYAARILRNVRGMAAHHRPAAEEPDGHGIPCVHVGSGQRSRAPRGAARH
jgi:hypothetical protein